METDKRTKETETKTQSRPILEVDLIRYAKYLDGLDLTDDQKLHWLAAAMPIVNAFADLGFGIHPVQLSCGKLAERTDGAAFPPADMVELDDTPNAKNFNAVAEKAET